MKLIIGLLPISQLKPVNIQHIKGNLWQGTLQLQYQRLKANMQWEVHPSYLVSSTQSVLNIQLSSTHSKLTLASNFQELMSPQLRLTGTLNSQEISSQLSLPQRAKMTGDITIKQLQFSNNPPYYLSHADIEWTGGQVSANNKNSHLPALQLHTQQTPEGLVSQLKEASNQKQLVLVTAHNNKQADINVTQRLLSLLNQGKLSDNEAEFVIRFTEQLKF